MSEDLASQELWSDVDAYLTETMAPDDEVLKAALADSDVAGLPAIQVSGNQGKLLQLLARTAGARKILEIGTLGGYSTIWLARALPEGGRMVTLEYEPRRAEVARGNLARAGLSEVVEVRIGRAADSLAQLEKEGAGPFDFVFIDADKPNNPVYLEWSLKLTRPGSLIVLDNAVRAGTVADSRSEDPSVLGTRRFFEMAAADPRLSVTAVQTVGTKGHDGFALALVTDA